MQYAGRICAASAEFRRDRKLAEQSLQFEKEDCHRVLANPRCAGARVVRGNRPHSREKTGRAAIRTASHALRGAVFASRAPMAETDQGGADSLARPRCLLFESFYEDIVRSLPRKSRARRSDRVASSCGETFRGRVARSACEFALQANAGVGEAGARGHGSVAVPGSDFRFDQSFTLPCADGDAQRCGGMASRCFEKTARLSADSRAAIALSSKLRWHSPPR
jgi:hypothetical protein